MGRNFSSGFNFVLISSNSDFDGAIKAHCAEHANSFRAKAHSKKDNHLHFRMRSEGKG